MPGVNYFPELYVSNPPDGMNAIELDGFTESLTAQATLTPGETYELKMVIADRGDAGFDSAVFFRAGSFDIGNVDLGVDLTVVDGTARCEGTPFTLAPGIQGPPGTTFEWTFEDPIGSGTFSPFVPAETGPTLEITTTGNYQVEVDFNGLCTTFGEVLVEFAPPFPVNEMPDPLVVCDPNNDGFAPFDLTLADLDITMGDPDLSVTYHGTFIDADLDQFPLAIPYVNDQAYTDTPITDPADPAFGTGGVWARVTTTMSACYEVVPLELQVRDSPVAVTPAEPLRMCDDAVADGLTTFDLTVVEPEVLGGADPLEFDIYYYDTEAEAILAGMNALENPDFSMAITTPGAYINIATPQIIYILVVGNLNSTSPNNGTFGCYDIVELTLIVDPLPLDFGPFEMMLCDDELNGSTDIDEISTFDLTSINDAATGSNPAFSVMWYETPADEASDNPIMDPTMYQNTSTPQTIIGRVTTEFDCSITITLTLTVLPVPHPKEDPTALELCDDDDDGLVAGFMLTDRDVEIVDGEPDVNILYYLTEQEAMDAVVGTELVSPYTNVVPNSQIVYARVTKNVPPALVACYTIVELELVVIALPDMPDLTFQDPFISCDENGDGDAVFDLTLQDASVLGVQDPADFVLPITYYLNLADALVPTNEIDPATSFTSGGQPIWVRLESTVTGCSRITRFELEVGTFPTIGVGADLFECDDEIGGSTPVDGLSTFDLTVNTTLIDMGDIDLNVNYYANAADLAANLPITTPEAYQNVDSPVQEIFVNVFNGEGCAASNSFFINVEPNPGAITPEPLVACDEDNDGFFDMFDLTTKDLEIQNGELDVSTTYYVTLLDAQTGDPADMLLSPYANIVPFSQTIYARVVRMTPPGINPCVTIVPMELRVELLPNEPDALTFKNPFEQCDDDMDGFAVFDLTENDDPVLSTQDNPMDFLPVTYYEDITDADMGINPILVPDSYTNLSNPQTVYVRAENSLTGCYRVTEFELIVNPLPVLAVGPYEQLECDDEQNGSTPDDGISTFDLTMSDGVITDNNTTYSVQYYLSAEDQMNDTPIADPTNHQNIDPITGAVINPQDIFVSVFTGPGCRVDTNITLEVLPNPTPSTPEPLEICDGDGDPAIDIDRRDGLSVFDLTSKNIEILNGEPGVTVVWYETFELAEAGELGTEIPTPGQYENTTPDSQIVYARVTRDTPPAVLACFTIVELELRVNPLPDDGAVVTNLIACEVSNDGIAIFDLTQKDEELLNGQDATLFNVVYYLSQSDAQLSVNPILNPTAYANTSNPQPIYASIVQSDTGCYIASEMDPISGESTLAFELIVKEGAIANAPISPYVICDNVDPNDGLAAFTLKSNAGSPTELDAEADALNAEILAGQDPAIYIVTFYETLENAESGTDPLGDIYNNVVNPQVIFARVTNQADPLDENPCYAVVEVTLGVEVLPAVVLEEEYRLCTDGGVAIPEVEGDPSPPIIETGLDPTLYTFSWSINGEIQPNEIDSFIVAIVPGSYEVVITELDSGCTSTVTTTVIESSPPQVYDVDVTTGAFSDSHTIEATVSEGAGMYVYSLDNGPFQDEGIFNNVTAGTHTVTIKDANGCGSVTVEIGVIDYSQILTPNGDGTHDTWNITGLGSADPTAKIYIFDRLGKLLKQISPTGPGWDGTYQGNPLPSSDYWFRIEYKEDDTSKEFRGHFTLKR
jgi:gliding motility-associated-like protein